MDINDLLLERGRLVDSMRGILDKAEAEDRDLTADEQETYAKMESDEESVAKRIARMNKLAAAESSLEAPVSNGTRMVLDDGHTRASDAYRAAFEEYTRKGKNALSGDFLNALQVGTDSEGGYITPEEYDTMLVEALQDINEFRNYVTVVNTESDRNIPVESTLGSATWTAEEAAYTESDAAFGQVVLGAHKLGTIIKVSEELLMDAFFDVGSYLARNFGKRFGLAEEAAFVNGNGSGKPTGFFGSASAGVTAAGAAAITADEMIDLYHSLGRPYRKNAVWVMKDSTVKLIRKLKDSDGQYIWQPGLQAGQPDRILARPLITSSAAPAATTGLKSVAFGDLSYYTVADRAGTVVQRLNELYAANGQVGFRAFKRMDGKLTLAESIKVLTQA